MLLQKRIKHGIFKLHSQETGSMWFFEVHSRVPSNSCHMEEKLAVNDQTMALMKITSFGDRGQAQPISIGAHLFRWRHKHFQCCKPHMNMSDTFQKENYILVQDIWERLYDTVYIYRNRTDLSCHNKVRVTWEELAPEINNAHRGPAGWCDAHIQTSSKQTQELDERNWTHSCQWVWRSSKGQGIEEV